MALRTSPMGMTPSFSPSASSENSANASLISASSCAVMSFSRASLDSLVLPVPAPDSATAAAFRLGGYMHGQTKCCAQTENYYTKRRTREEFLTYHFCDNVKGNASPRERNRRTGYDVRMSVKVEQLQRVGGTKVERPDCAPKQPWGPADFFLGIKNLCRVWNSIPSVVHHKTFQH